MKYHIDIHPELGVIQYKAMPVVYTRHARVRAGEKQIELASFLDILPGQVFEFERLPGGIPKLAIRKPYDDVWDVCYVLLPSAGKRWRVKTVWKNKKTDRHSTLDKSNYCAPGKKAL